MKKQQIIYIALIVILLIVFIISAVYVGSYFLESHKQKAEFDELASIVANIQSQTTPSTESTKPTNGDRPEDPTADETDPTGGEPEETVPTMLPEYEPLYEMNSDIVGWIRIDDTAVNYPVMQTPDSANYYLKRNFNKNYSSQGCIYVREQCDVNEPSDNLTIYGHHMRDGSMFYALDRFVNKSYWEKNNLIYFDTLYEHHTYQVFAVFKTTATVGKGFSYHLFVDANDEAEFNEYVGTCKDLALYDTGITPVYGDKLITLSTCEYSQTNGRLVVVAVRID